VILEVGQAVYIESNMGHAYIAAEGCDEVLLLGVCSSADEQLMESLMTLHGDEAAAASPALRLKKPATQPAPPPAKKKTAPAR
jgi:hypothetical protein